MTTPSPPRRLLRRSRRFGWATAVGACAAGAGLVVAVGQTYPSATGTPASTTSSSTNSSSSGTGTRTKTNSTTPSITQRPPQHGPVVRGAGTNAQPQAGSNGS